MVDEAWLIQCLDTDMRNYKMWDLGPVPLPSAYRIPVATSTLVDVQLHRTGRIIRQHGLPE